MLSQSPWPSEHFLPAYNSFTYAFFINICQATDAAIAEPCFFFSLLISISTCSARISDHQSISCLHMHFSSSVVLCNSHSFLQMYTNCPSSSGMRMGIYSQFPTVPSKPLDCCCSTVHKPGMGKQLWYDAVPASFLPMLCSRQADSSSSLMGLLMYFFSLSHQ